MEIQFKKALLEASKWQEQATQYEKTKISFEEARQNVIDRIFEKYKIIIITNASSTQKKQEKRQAN